MLDKLKELGVTMVVADITDNSSEQSETIKQDLSRAGGRVSIPVNLIYPADYPNSPAILLEELISPSDALAALKRMENTTSGSVAQVPTNSSGL